MQIVPFDESMLLSIIALWNKAVSAELPYKSFTLETFQQKFLENPHFDAKFFFVCLDESTENRIIGFAQGIIKNTFLPGETKENTPGYITMIAVSPARRREGIGTALLKALEKAFQSEGKTKTDIIFFNPINLEWIVPGTDGHEHPNTPGVLLGSPGFAFFTRHGYETIAEQNSYHRALQQLPPSEDVPKVSKILSSLAEKNIVITSFHPDKHFGLDALFDDLNNEHWRHEINTHLKTHPEWPLLVVSDGGKVVGFAGPVYPQPNGRGFFAGIGVHSAYGGMGIGTALFYRLCETEKEYGAAYMTLFTGVTNPARKMYEAAGFTITAQWADMRK